MKPFRQELANALIDTMKFIVCNIVGACVILVLFVKFGCTGPWHFLLLVTIGAVIATAMFAFAIKPKTKHK